MRKAEFEVPAELMPAFAEELTNSELSNQILGVTEDNEIIIEVQYERDEVEAVNELEEFLDKLIEEAEEDEDEDEDDED